MAAQCITRKSDETFTKSSEFFRSIATYSSGMHKTSFRRHVLPGADQVLRFTTVFVAMAVLAFALGCRSRREDSGGEAAAATPNSAPTFMPEATIKDLMLGLVDTSADTVWLSVTTTVDDRGIVDVEPKNDEEWTEVRYGALRLAEASNLLLMPRRVAPPGDKSVAPGVELEPEEMQVLIDKDRAGWNERAAALHDAAMLAVRAAESKEPAKIFEVGETIEHACENCHRQYWYPNEKVPDLPAVP